MGTAVATRHSLSTFQYSSRVDAGFQPESAPPFIELYDFVYGLGMGLAGAMERRGHQLRFVTDERPFRLQVAVAKQIRALVLSTMVQCIVAAAVRRRIGLTVRVFRLPGGAVVSISETTLPDLARYGWPSDHLRFMCTIGPGRSPEGQRLRVTWHPARPMACF